MKENESNVSSEHGSVSCDGVPEVADIKSAQKKRDLYIKDLQRLLPSTPQLNDSDAQDIFDLIVEQEQRIVPSLSVHEYIAGTAQTADEISVERTSGSVVLSADHATSPFRNSIGAYRDPDHGTGGLVFAFSKQKLGDAVVPVGRQTGNANMELVHPLKDELAKTLPDKRGFLSVHGMKPGKFSHLIDSTEIHGVIGLGSEPNDVSRSLAEDMRSTVRDKYGLRVVIGNDERFFDATDKPGLPTNEDGSLKYSTRLAALMEGSTTNFVNRSLADTTFLAMQLELSRTLRLLPKEIEYRERRARTMSVYMGYLVTREFVTLVDKYAA